MEGLYRRCGIVPIVTELVKALMTSPQSAPLESDEQGVLNAGSALKQMVRQQESLIPDGDRQQWLHAAGRYNAAGHWSQLQSADPRQTRSDYSLYVFLP